MKRCPECRRDYYDDTLLYCLDDGNSLLEGPRSADAPVRPLSDEPATAIILDFGVSPSGSARPEPGAIATGFPVGEAKTSVFRNAIDAAIENTNSIAVLPFVNMSADADNEYFCDGLAEELLNSLAKIDHLRVAARTSAFSFKHKDVEVGEIGRILNVRSVLEGSVRKSGERLRISVQLVNAADGYQLWSERYDREMRDIFDVQDEIAMSVISALKLKLLGGEESSVLRRETENTEAYKAYLKGRYLRYAKNDHAAAAVEYEEALRLDASHAPSWLGLAESYMLRAHYALVRPLKACAASKEALQNARNIQGESAEALYIEGFTAFIERNWHDSDTAYRRSLAIDPGNSRALGTCGIVKCVLGQKTEAMALFARARDADPLAAYPYAMTGGGLVLLRQPGEAMPFLEQALAFENDNSLALWMYCEACVGLKRYEEAVATVETAMQASRRPPFLLGVYGCALVAAGKSGEAMEVLDELRSRPADSPVLIHEACILGALGDRDAAFDVLSRAVDEYAPMATYIGLPSFDSIREYPRFSAHTELLGLPNQLI